MTIKERVSGDVTILDLDGKITLGEGDVLLRDTISKLVDNKTVKVILNLENVSYMDSGGLGEVVRSYTSVRNAGGDVKLLKVAKRISDLLTITKLHTVFDTFDDEAEAVGSFK
ncbi:MAG: STAS domain-containing protein [Acidobacteria bacterium]|nr:STAS domain-containing protein [Acidobacteriota bacterium]